MQLILVNQNSWLQIDFLFYFSLPLALCHVNNDRVFGATLKKTLISVILRLNSKYYFKKKGKLKLLPQLLQATKCHVDELEKHLARYTAVAEPHSSLVQTLCFVYLSCLQPVANQKQEKMI